MQLRFLKVKTLLNNAFKTKDTPSKSMIYVHTVYRAGSVCMGGGGGGGVGGWRKGGSSCQQCIDPQQAIDRVHSNLQDKTHVNHNQAYIATHCVTIQP